MNKIPAFQFYPADWRKDVGVQSLSYHDRGVWFEILCLMHESEDRGKLILNGHSMTEEILARLLGLDKQVFSKTLAVLLKFGVCSRGPDGSLLSRRMVRDEHIRQIRKKSGKKGGNPNLLNQNSTKTKTKRKNEVKQKSTPSSSSSTSSSEDKEYKQYARAEFDYPLKLLFEAFPDLQLTPGKLGMVEAAVTEADREAWENTITLYLGNHDRAKNRYLPEKIATVLRVFNDEKRKLEREKNGGNPRTTTIDKDKSAVDRIKRAEKRRARNKARREGLHRRDDGDCE